ncbi:MAG TPA: ribulokinase [Fimbriimonas sp.]|nr:ribulokinase [Fimbriimonas sp.]
MAKLTIGLDYGTNSVRALLVDVANGDELATSVFNYPSGEAGILLKKGDHNLARQNPADYIEGFYAVVREVLKGIDPKDVIGIGVDTTGSSPLPVDASGTPLAMSPEFKDNLAAQCWLWKDHTSFAEAAEITEKARELGKPYLAKCGGTYSSEWFWSKILHCARTAPDVFDSAASWVECCDFVTGYLTGNQPPDRIARSVCAAGHKAMYNEDWGGYPSVDFLNALDPRLGRLRQHLGEAQTSDTVAGRLSDEVAAKSGLPVGIPVAVGAFDAHFGAVASGASPGVLVKIMGTSTCDCMVHPLDQPLEDVPGLCGIVNGSILPDCYGLEAGQSAVGDLFNWFVSFSGRSHAELSREAEELQPGQSGLVALDWNNGNRTVLVDPLLTGLLVGQTLHTTPGEVYRALIEATAFGSLKIIERLEQYGVVVEQVVACGGIAEKSRMVMQIYADVFNRPVKVSRSAQTCALGSAIFAAVVGGAYESVQEAQSKMTGFKEAVYSPDPEAVSVYGRVYKLYSQLHDSFGIQDCPGSLANVMKDLLEIQNSARS